MDEKESIPVDYHDEKLELPFRSLLEYFQARMILKDNFAGVCFTAVDVRYLGSLVCMVANLFELCSLLLKAQTSRLAAAVGEKNKQSI